MHGTAWLPILLLCSIIAQASGGALRINEIARAHELPVALQHVSVEVYNPGPDEIDMRGMRFFVGSSSWEIENQMIVAPRSFQVFNFGKKLKGSINNIGLELSWQGGTIMLWDASGSMLLDMFIYPALMDKGSFGRCPDGAVQPAYGESPSIGVSCAEVITAEARASEVTMKQEGDRVTLLASDGHAIRYTLDGSEPTVSSALYSEPVIVQDNAVVKARTYVTGKHPGKLFVESVLLPVKGREAIALAISERDLWNNETGIYTMGEHANFSRKGKEWERSVLVQCMDDDGQTVRKDDFGIRISGSGTRSLPKRSFKIFRRDRYGDAPLDFFCEIPVDEIVVRADGTPNSYLRNKFIEESAKKFATHSDIQESRNMDVYLNGSYWGTYRAMPAKDAKWLEEKHGFETIDMLAGSAHRIVSGTDAGWNEVVALLLKQELNKVELDLLDGLVDIQSMIELAAFDLFTGRADHEFNTRVWRPADPAGKWRWVLYDFDLWALYNDPSLDRMLMEPASSAPFISAIWHTPVLQEQLLAYLCGLMNGPLQGDEASNNVESLFYDERDHMLRDLIAGAGK